MTWSVFVGLAFAGVLGFLAGRLSCRPVQNVTIHLPAKKQLDEHAAEFERD
jgi:hypothetical protein